MEYMPERKIAELLFMNRVATAANAALQTNDMLPTVVNDIVQTLNWDRAVIGLREVDTTLQVIVASKLLHEHAEELATQDETATNSDYALILETINSTNITLLNASDPSLKGTSVADLLAESGFQTILSIPLHGEDKPYGSLLACATETREVSQDELRLFETIAELLVIAIKRISQYEEAKQADRLKSAFLARVTHELRTPVTSVIGYVQMMQRGRFGIMPDHLKEPVDAILDSSKRLRRLVNDLLDFSKMEAGHLNVEHASVHIEPAITNVVRMMKPQVDESGLNLIVDITPDLPPIRADSNRLEQVLTNLLSNAVKFTDEGKVTVRVERQGDYVRLSVQDEGIGVTPEHQALIFGEYQQIKNQHTIRFAGTGLGLAISRRLVELMGGSMALVSEFGIGSTFYCDFRIASEHQPGKDGTPPEDA
jgi:signal transduction histidine kinase